jgi:hypothetical protein
MRYQKILNRAKSNPTQFFDRMLSHKITIMNILVSYVSTFDTGSLNLSPVTRDLSPL